MSGPGSWQGPQTEASFLPGVWSPIYFFSLCHSPLSPLPLLNSEFSLNPHSELT